MSKRNYRIHNWKSYNAALINRGKITLWLDEESIKNWYALSPERKRGRTKKYSDMAIMTTLLLKQVYRLTLRACERFMCSLVELLKLNIEIPCYTQISRRQYNKMEEKSGSSKVNIIGVAWLKMVFIVINNYCGIN